MNLDGYDSEYNLQFARKHSKDLMYISFNDGKLQGVQQKQSKQERFWKKVMFNFSKVEQDNQLLEQKIKYDPQSYQNTINTVFKSECFQNTSSDHSNMSNNSSYSPFYSYQAEQQYQDEFFNQNVYFLPLGWQKFKQNFKQIISDEDFQPYYSNIIRFYFMDILLPRINNFGPKMIIVSYSGRLSIQTNHFIQIMQQLTPTCYRMLFFPNLTTYMCEAGKEQLQEFPYDNLVRDKSLGQQQMMGIFDVIGIFIKISSGTYNTNPNLEQDIDLRSKYKNAKAFKYVYQICQCLCCQYNNINSLKSIKHVLLSQQAFYRQKLRNAEKEIEKAVPVFFRKLYSHLYHSILYQDNQEFSQSNYRKSIQDLITTFCRLSEWEHYKNQFQKFFNDRKYLHFLELSILKYHQNVHLHFYQGVNSPKISQNAENPAMNSLQGTYFVNFKDSNKQTLPIYPYTQIIYQNRQPQQGQKYYYIIINNHISINSENPTDYIALVKKNNKYFKSQQSQATQIALLDQNGNLIKRQPYQAYINWNYTQTDQYLILFWPTLFDYIKMVIQKMQKKKYHPSIINEIFIAKKSTINQIQSQANFKFWKFNYLTEQQQIIPRVGCSSYHFRDKLFIFGGFYQKDKNYLQLQHDITTFDLANLLSTRKIIVSNIKGMLYGHQATNNKIKQKQTKTANSFVRPRMEYEFYEIEQLSNTNNEIIQVDSNSKNKKVIMFGGYGQNFLRPYSILTYYYYELGFNKQQRMLTSIQKKTIYGKAVPINTKYMSKNRRLYSQLNCIDDNDKSLKIGKLNNNHYLFHHVLYNFQSNSNNELNGSNFDFEIKSFYAFAQYHLFSQQFESIAQRLGQIEENIENEQVRVVNSNKVNHYVVACRGKKQYFLSLFYENKNNESTKLSNDSIKSIDIKNKKIYAIIQNPLLTKGKSILAICDISLNHTLQFEQLSSSNQPLKVLLKFVQQFQQDLSMHLLLACNENLILILHGPLLSKNTSIKQYLVKVKYNGQDQIYQIKKKQQLISTSLSNNSKQCYSFFFKIDQKIQCYTLSSCSDSSQILTISFHNINLPDMNIKWHQYQSYDNFLFIQQNQGKINPILLKMQIVEMRKDKNDKYYFKIIYNDEELVIQITKSYPEKYKGLDVYLLNINMKVQSNQWINTQNAKRIVKTLERYDDLIE